jgi:hypothetical protein
MLRSLDRMFERGQPERTSSSSEGCGAEPRRRRLEGEPQSRWPVEGCAPPSTDAVGGDSLTAALGVPGPWSAGSRSKINRLLRDLLVRPAADASPAGRLARNASSYGEARSPFDRQLAHPFPHPRWSLVVCLSRSCYSSCRLLRGQLLTALTSSRLSLAGLQLAALSSLLPGPDLPTSFRAASSVAW